VVGSRRVSCDRFGCGVGDHEAVAVAEHCIAHRRLHAHGRRRPDHHQLLDTAATKHSVQLGAVEARPSSASEGFAQRVFSGERHHGLPLSTMTKSNAITMHAATAAMTAPDVTKANGFNIGTTLTPTPPPDKRRSYRDPRLIGASRSAVMAGY